MRLSAPIYRRRDVSLPNLFQVNVSILHARERGGLIWLSSLSGYHFHGRCPKLEQQLHAAPNLPHMLHGSDHFDFCIAQESHVLLLLRLLQMGCDQL